MIYYDTETCGFHGPIVLLQYAYDDGEIELYCPWKNTIYDTIQLIEEMMDHEGGVCGFNLAFDHFHLCQMYTTLKLMKNQHEHLEDRILDYAIAEKRARFSDICLKPVHAIDLMTYARKGPYQSTMDRHDIRIKKVPTPLSNRLVVELNKRIKFKDIHFARKKDKKERWKVYDIKDDLDDVIPEFKDVVLKFAPSSALKSLVVDIGLRKETSRLLFGDISLPDYLKPKEIGYAPYALSVGKPGKWNGAWPQVINEHISHWAYNPRAREYARDDVVDTRNLYRFFSHQAAGIHDEEALTLTLNASPIETPLPVDDDDSILSCMVGAVRWRGFAIDIPRLKSLRVTSLAKLAKSKYNFNSVDICKEYLSQVLTETEKLGMVVNGKLTTKGVILEEMAKWTIDEVHVECKGMGCHDCEDGLVKTDKRHLAAIRASEILTYRRAGKEIELYDKLLLAGRFHASFKVIGALSSRMAGADGLNAQGVKRTKEIRSCFQLADEGMHLVGGDFAGSQVSIADAVYGDPVLHEKLISKHTCYDCNGAGCDECNKTGKVTYKIHGLFGIHLFPEYTYEQLLATKGLPNEQDKYGRSKNGVFAMLFGGEVYTLQTRVGISEKAANDAYHSWISDHIVWGEERKKYFDMFCSMRQPNGIGTKVEWHEPSDYVEALFGFRRYFTLENRICRTLFQLADNPPETWSDIKIRVMRRDRFQTATGAIRSALFASAFSVQAANMRAAANHVIQSPEALMVKDLQCRIWTLQPAGSNPWFVQPLNVHDEIMAVTRKNLAPRIREIVDDFIIEYKESIPLIGIDWSNHLTTWADK